MRPSEKNTRYVQYKEWDNPEYGNVVENIFREQAIRTMQRARRKLLNERHQKNEENPVPSDIHHKAISQVTNSNSMLRVISEPIDDTYLNLATSIKDKAFTLLDFTDTNFILNLYKALRLNKINLSEFFLVYQIYYTKEWFGHFDFPCNEMAQIKFTDPNGPYQPSSIQYAKKPQIETFLAFCTSTNAEYVTVNLGKRAEQAFFETGMAFHYKHEYQTPFFYVSLKKYVAKNIAAYRAERKNPVVFEDLLTWTQSDTALSEMDLSTKGQFDCFFSEEFIRKNEAETSQDLDYSTMSFLHAALGLEEELPSFVISPDHCDGDFNTPTLSFVAITLDDLNQLQEAVHGEETEFAVPIAGQFDIRIVRDYFEKKSGRYERPIELFHPNLTGISAPHSYFSHKQMATFHDLLHAWRAGSNFKLMFQHLLNIFTQKGVCQTKSVVMSNAIAALVDMDTSLGEHTRKNNKHFDPLTEFEKDTQEIFLTEFELLFESASENHDVLLLLAIDFIRNREKWDQFVASILQISSYDGLFLSYWLSAISHVSPVQNPFSYQISGLLQSDILTTLCAHKSYTTESIILRSTLISSLHLTLLCDTVDAIGIEKLFYWGANTGLHFHHDLRHSIDAHFSLSSYAYAGIPPAQCENIILLFIKNNLTDVQYRKFLHDVIKIDKPFFEFCQSHQLMRQEAISAIEAGLFLYDSLEDFLMAFSFVTHDRTRSDLAFANTVDQIIPFITDAKDFWKLAESLSHEQAQLLLSKRALSDTMLTAAVKESPLSATTLFCDVLSIHPRTESMVEAALHEASLDQDTPPKSKDKNPFSLFQASEDNVTHSTAVTQQGAISSEDDATYTP